VQVEVPKIYTIVQCMPVEADGRLRNVLLTHVFIVLGGYAVATGALSPRPPALIVEARQLVQQSAVPLQSA
jgi:hypothetical protein